LSIIVEKKQLENPLHAKKSSKFTDMIEYQPKNGQKHLVRVPSLIVES
jgi:hypothetical protein